MITFHHASNLARQLGEFMSLTNPNNPSAINHWCHLDDTPEGRVELRRRVRAIVDASRGNPMFLGEGRMAELLAYAKENLENG